MALRIEWIRFNSWGCFVNHPIDLAGPGKVDLIYGENATGKSTTGRGLRSLLYGIDARTGDDHTYPYSELRIGARVLIDGKPVELWRVKKRSAPLLDSDGQSLPGDPIAAGLGGLGEEVYSGLFHVDKETLDQGAEELLSGGGEVGESLFAAAAGIRSLHETLAGLDAEAEANYNPPRGRKGALETATRELRECEKRLRAATLKPQRHASLTAELRRAEESAEAIAAEIHALEARMRTTERRRTIAPMLVTHAKLTAELAPIAEAPLLPPQAASERSSAQALLRAGEAQLERARKDLEELDSQIAAVDVDEELLASAEAIAAAKDKVSAVVKAGKDRRKLEGELHSANALLEAAARTVGLPAEEVTSARLSHSASRALDAAIAHREEISTRLTSAKIRFAKARKARDGADGAISRHPVARDLGALEAALDAAQGASALTEQAGTLEAEHKTKAEQARFAFEQLRPRPSEISELGGLAVPSSEQAEDASAEITEIAGLSRALDAEDEALAKRRLELDEESDRLRAEGEALTQEELAQARVRREEAWGPIRSGGEAGERLDAEVAEDFEAAIGAADQLADRRADASERLGRAAAHDAASKRLESEAIGIQARRHELIERKEAAFASWSDLWKKSGLEPLGAESATAWLSARASVLDLDSQATRAKSEAAAAREREAGHSRSLRDELAVFGAASKESLTLAGLCARARKLVEGERELASGRVALETKLRGFGESREEAEEELERAEEALSAWRESWPARLEESGLPSGTGPADAQEFVRAMREASGHREQIEGLERRIAGIDADREDFAGRIVALCKRLASELVELDAESAATALHGRLAEHEKRAERLAARVEQREGCNQELARAEDEISQARAALGALLKAAGVEDEAQLPEIEQRSDRVRSLGEEIAALEHQVVAAGEDDFEALVGEVEGFDRDAAAVELQELAEQIEERRDGRDRVREEIVTRRQALVEVEVDTAAVRAREDVELALSRVEAAALAHARARLAATVVRRAIERYRREHESPMLNRTKELFGRFSQKTFSDLYVEVEDSGVAVLVGRHFDGALKKVGEMSKGTREQLYLALRIAAIERYVETTGPVPVTFDDVFSESDEPRSQRIFEALGELAEKTQVTVLTHHRHLIEVGNRALGEKLAVQELPPVAPSLRVAEAA
jgi:uncharacterized protein YhaN